MTALSWIQSLADARVIHDHRSLPGQSIAQRHLRYTCKRFAASNFSLQFGDLAIQRALWTSNREWTHMKPTDLRCIGLLLIATTAHAQPDAETAEFAPAADNTLYEREAGDLSNGAGPSLFFGRTGENAGNVLRRALLRFDLDTIPAGSEIVEARLVIEVDLVPPTATGFDATLHALNASWGEAGSFAPGAGGGGAPAQEGDATWLHRFYDTEFWGLPGGDFAPDASAIAPLDAGTGTFAFDSTATLVEDVQRWVDQPASNFGWMIRGEEDNPQNARRIASRENPNLAPRLEVTFVPGVMPPQARAIPLLSPWALIMLVASLLFVAWRRNRAEVHGAR